MVEATYILLAFLAFISALMVVFSRHAVYAALYLVVTMLAIAGLFVIINAQLAAALQILVYAGAIMVLFLFVIMLLNLREASDPPAATRGVRAVGAFFFVALIVQIGVLVSKFSPEVVPTENHAEAVDIGQIAMSLMTRYVFAFEATSILLLVAVIGAMTLARKKSANGSAAAIERGDG